MFFSLFYQTTKIPTLHIHLLLMVHVLLSQIPNAVTHHVEALHQHDSSEVMVFLNSTPTMKYQVGLTIQMWVVFFQ